MASKKHARSESTDGYINQDALKHPSTKRAKEIDAHTPYETLCDLVNKTKRSDTKPRNVLHWFRSKDIRQEDNKALYAAAQKAKEGSGSLLTIYLFSPKDMDWHGTSAARTDLILQSLQILKEQLEDKSIPLALLTSEERGLKADKVMQFVQEHDVSHIYANMEYEVDELRRDISVAKHVQDQKDLAFDLLHDQTVVVPGALTTGSGGPHKVFTPYHKSWLAETKKNPSLLDTVPPPEGNEKQATETYKKLFETRVPDLPDSKQYATDEERDRLRKLWPRGNKGGMERLADFLDAKVSNYASDRSKPAKDPSSRLSPYFAAGIVSVREVLQKAKEYNKGKHFDEGDAGVSSWVREIVFREFYRHVLVGSPHTSMNLPQNMKFDHVEWEDDKEGWKRWCEGTTGVPFVDAGMRQLNTEAYMHNRLRMNTSSYLSANLLIDYRKGERYFAEHLVDWDLSNNTQGWEPSYTVFNPVSQAEKCDPNGDYIRKWVPELKDLHGKDIFAPYERLSETEFNKLGYPKPHVDYKESSQRAKSRYKRDLADADP